MRVRIRNDANPLLFLYNLTHLDQVNSVIFYGQKTHSFKLISEPKPHQLSGFYSLNKLVVQSLRSNCVKYEVLCKLCIMAYNKTNYNKRARFIIEVYKGAKNPDVPDTKIVSKEFPKHGINISYRQWMNIKGMPIPKETNT